MHPEPVFEEEALVIDVNHLWNVFRARLLLILSISASVAVITGAGSFLFCKEYYQSTGTLLFSPDDAYTVITEVDMIRRFFKEEAGTEANPYKNQEELLKSQQIATRVFEKLKEQGIKPPVGRPESMMGNVISAEMVKGSDFIRIMAKAGNAKAAKAIATTYMDVYRDEMQALSNQPLREQKSLFENQIAEAETELQSINNRIRDYQNRYGILDLAIESQNRVHKLVDLDSEAKDIQVSLAQRKAEATSIRNQLKLNKQDITVAINAAACGQDEQLNKLQDELQQAQKDYAAQSLSDSATSPNMQQLQHTIDLLTRQIADQQIVSVGQTFSSRTGVIKDSLRRDLVSRLASSESDISALQSKLATVRSQYSQMREMLHDLPEHELEYARMQLDKKSKEEILTRLKEKLADVQIQLASAHKKLTVIDAPSLPLAPLFPQRWHIMALAALMSGILSTIGILGKVVLNRREVNQEDFIERSLGLPVLSTIPWISDTQWRNYRKRGMVEVTATAVEPGLLKAYQDLALNLKAQRHQSPTNVLVLSSLTCQAEHSVILANLAFCLAQSGESVLLMDANLRNPRLHEMFNHALDYEHGLPELINSISDFLYRKGPAESEELLALVQTAATPSDIHPQLDYLNAGVPMENTFAFLNSKGCGTLIKTLKAGYDWVLIDAPPFLQYPDAAILLGNADGLLLLVEQNAEESQVATVCKKIAKLNSRISGVVLRKHTS